MEPLSTAFADDKTVAKAIVTFLLIFYVDRSKNVIVSAGKRYCEHWIKNIPNNTNLVKCSLRVLCLKLYSWIV